MPCCSYIPKRLYQPQIVANKCWWSQPKSRKTNTSSSIHFPNLPCRDSSIKFFTTFRVFGSTYQSSPISTQISCFKSYLRCRMFVLLPSHHRHLLYLSRAFSACVFRLQPPWQWPPPSRVKFRTGWSNLYFWGQHFVLNDLSHSVLVYRKRHASPWLGKRFQSGLSHPQCVLFGAILNTLETQKFLLIEILSIFSFNATWVSVFVCFSAEQWYRYRLPICKALVRFHWKHLISNRPF